MKLFFEEFRKDVIVDPKDVKSIDLLSYKEAARLPKDILYNPRCPQWWLKDKGDFEYDEYGRKSNVYVMSVCNSTGIFTGGNEVWVKLDVRPALRIVNLPDLQIGDTIKVFGERWAYIGNSRVLLDGTLGEKAFSSYKATTDYKSSSIKDFIDDWLEQKKQDSYTMMKDHIPVIPISSVIGIDIPSTRELGYDTSILKSMYVWWTRTKASKEDEKLITVMTNGHFNYDGCDINYRFIDVRPMLKISNLPTLNIGDRVSVFDRFWIYLGDDKVLLADTIGEHIFDEKSSNYQKSELKKYITKWLYDQKMKYRE